MVVSSVPKNIGEQVLAFGVDGENRVGPVVHVHLGFHFQGLVDVAVVGVAVIP